MKFNEKLQSLRKQNKLSQEQLADKLEVSRQAVSKWESGQTYPEMDKLISMCKIFHCTLDDLTNDEVKEIIPKKPQNTMNLFLEDIINMVQKTFTMFKSMNAKEITHLIIEMLIVFIIILLFHMPVEYIYQLGENIFKNLEPVSSLLSSIWNFILEMMYIVLSIFAFLYIFKIRYLDSFVKKEKQKPEIISNQDDIVKENMISEEKLSNKKVVIEKKEPKKERNFVFFSVLANLWVIFLKCCAAIIGVPFLFTLFLLSFAFIIAIILIFKGIYFLGIIIGIIAMITLNVLLLEILITFLFNKTIKLKRFLITLIASIGLLGIGAGITVFDISTLQFLDEAPNNQQPTTISETYPLTEDLQIQFPYYNGFRYIVDNNLGNNIKVEATYYSNYQDVNISMSNNMIGIYHYYNDKRNFPEEFRSILDDLKQKKIHNYGRLDDLTINIYGSTESLNQLKQNQQKYQIQMEEERYHYQATIDNLETQITSLQQEINDLETEKFELKRQYELELEDYRQTIQDYKQKLSELLSQ